MYHCDILIVDDEQMVRSSLQRLLESESWRITTAGGVRDAEKILTDRRFDLAVIDYKLEDGTGLDVLEFIQHQNLDVITIILTAYGNISLAVETVKMGAYDFLEKESDPEILRHVVGKALERVHLKKEVEILQENCRCTDDQRSIVAGSPVMQRVMKIADEYARYTATVLIDGETGTGKSLLAEYIHCQGERKDRPFITINCGSIPKELIESELFGYEKGAFTGASKEGKIGLIERAHGGTLFLDEIGNLPLEMQAKLLYVLEKGEFIRVGGVEPITVDVRYIAATNANLDNLMQQGKFRNDLFYRLNIAHLTVPPLREHPDDILPLATMFVNDLNRKFRKRITRITDDAKELLRAYPWPGNIRELRNVLERIVLLSDGDALTCSDLYSLQNMAVPVTDDHELQVRVDLDSEQNVLENIREEVISRVWEMSEHNQSQAAKMLGVPRTTLQHHLQKYKLI